MAIDSSRCRQRIQMILREFAEEAQTLMQRKRLLRGSIYEMSRRCGKAGCICTRGKLHTTVCLSTSIKGKTKMQALRPEEIVDAQQWSANYRRFRKALKKIEALCRELLRLGKSLQQSQEVDIRGR